VWIKREVDELTMQGISASTAGRENAIELRLQNGHSEPALHAEAKPVHNRIRARTRIQSDGDRAESTGFPNTLTEILNPVG
jgi:hypothetical protein